nr:retrovirus-related Pol polyprotein from transposon TNT 1-94 [Tanacetum cinerariifolium]
MFDELLNPSPSVDHPAPEVIAPINEVIPPVQDDSTNSPSSTTVDQDAPSASKSHTTTEIQSPIIPQEVKEDNMDIEVAHIRNDPLLVEPKTYKDALTKSCWIEAMQEELNEFEQLEVWKLVPHPDKVIVITLKWIYRVKLDELGGILKNKARLVARGYRQEERIDFEESFASKSKLDVDKKGKAVDPSHYRVSRPDLQFAICMCAQYQARPTEKHVHAVKRIIRYLRGTVHRGLWYPKDSSVALTAFADADYTGCQDTRRSTSALGRDRIEFLINKLGMRSFTPETLKKLMDEVDE